MSKRKDEIDDQCFYCGATVGGLQGDHFPIPDRNGGTMLVMACDVCHKMKDSVVLENWATEWMSAVIADFPKMGRETKLFLGKAIALATDINRMRDNANKALADVARGVR